MNPLKAANPVTAAQGAIGLAGAAAGLAGTVARGAVHAPVGMARGALHGASAAAGMARQTVHVLWADHEDEHVTPPSGPAGAPQGPTVAHVEPHAPEEPPVDVVGEALAAEAADERGEGASGAGIAHEPHAASRDEEHGNAALRRATVEEIADETAAALEGDVMPEEPPTEPLLDPSDAKAAAAELKTMSKAARADKG